MKRRDFILTATAAAIALPGAAQAFVGLDYKPGLVKRRLDDFCQTFTVFQEMHTASHLKRFRFQRMKSTTPRF